MSARSAPGASEPADTAHPAPARPAEVDPATPAERGLAAFVRAHPWITTIMAVCTIGGAIAGPVFFDAEWPLARQIAAGAFLGAWVGLTITVTKMIG